MCKNICSAALKEWYIMKSIGQFKTKVSKKGKIEDYLNLPVLDRFSERYINKDNPKIIGTITGAVEKEDYFELTVSLFPGQIILKKEILAGSGRVCSLSIE